MKNSDAKKRGPKDRNYVNKSESYEVRHESKRKKPAKKFGSGGDDDDDSGQRK